MYLCASGTRIVLLTPLGPLCTWRWACVLSALETRILNYFHFSESLIPLNSLLLHTVAVVPTCVFMLGIYFCSQKLTFCLWKHFEPYGKVSVLTQHHRKVDSCYIPEQPGRFMGWWKLLQAEADHQLPSIQGEYSRYSYRRVLLERDQTQLWTDNH